ncbi:glycogen synthase GlgA [Bacillus sp. 1NLA3E]|uniref:glycogen synthase GlgA n=1 Tax=Bacillus sp. 1NLA3E TaxID=666686 RepID=UPI000247F35E|nr:glycogen synthase GlgA [Bacillus sp. 1NLA3E]AGK55319.1 glycogen synthase [Bacillus sp. 1NLA3E]
MKILHAVSECLPFIKSGGLADVAGSLPKELVNLGTDVRLILPNYETIPQQYKRDMRKVAEFTVKVGWRNQYCGILELVSEGLTYYFVDNEYYFKRDGLYGYFDDGERFSFFNRAVLEAIAHLNFSPDIIHCHDWHTGMIPFLHRVEYNRKHGYEFIRTIFTIHNLQFQGVFPKEILGDLLGIDTKYFNKEQLEFFGNINFLKAGLVSADMITTVSSTYLAEIQTAYFGENLDGLLRNRISDLKGILNGIDEGFYNPASDIFLYRNFDSDSISLKVENKRFVQRELGLVENDDIPLMVMITRLTKQKGLELVKTVFHEMMAEKLQMVVLGTGDFEFESFFREMSYQYPDQLRVQIGFNEEWAHQLYAAADLFLMPSKFEPCGLGQMIAMRYGSIPIVRETGGLNDTVRAYDEWADTGNGFSFTHFNAHDMLYTIRHSLSFYHYKKPIWRKMVKTAMNKDLSWAHSAFQYNLLYLELISRSASHVF